MSASLDMPNILLTRPESDGSKTLFLVSHKAKSVDFKMTPCKQLEDGSWEYCETYNDPETTGYFKLLDDGNKVELYATQPKKWCIKLQKNADGNWTEFGTQAVGHTAIDGSGIAPKPSLLGAGGLPKGQVNLGEQDDSFNALW